MTERRINIGSKVRALRTQRRWTQAELAQRLGLSQSRLSEIESGHGSFTAEQFLLILKLFNVGVSHFSSEATDPTAELHNVLARLGARHLRESENVLPSKQVEAVTDAVREGLVVAEPRIVTALAPVLVLHIDEINFSSVRAKLASVGLERRLSWLVENTVEALREELRRSPPAVWSRRYRRALVVLETAHDFVERQHRTATPAFDPENDPPDILDGHVRTKATLADVWASASPISRRWGIATSLQPRDFADALRAARASR